MWNMRVEKNWAPNFIVVGAPKAGTTSLYYYLKQHPDVFLPEKKELHFFSHEEICFYTGGPGDAFIAREVCKSWIDYERHFRGAENFSARGDISPSYLIHSDTAERIFKSLGKVKIIILLRDPVEKIISQYTHLCASGRETLLLEEALEAESERYKMNWADFWWYKKSSFLTNNAEVFLKIFGAENVMFISSDEFKINTRDVLSRVANFININDSFEFALEQTFNVSGMPKSKIMASIFVKPNLFTSTLRRFIPSRIGAPVRRFIISLNKGGKPVVNEKTKEKLNEIFYEEKKRIKEMTNFYF